MDLDDVITLKLAQGKQDEVGHNVNTVVTMSYKAVFELYSAKSKIAASDPDCRTSCTAHCMKLLVNVGMVWGWIRLNNA